MRAFTAGFCIATFLVTVFFGCNSGSNITRTPDQGVVVLQTESKRGNLKIFVNDVPVGTAPQELIFACGDTVKVRVE